MRINLLLLDMRYFTINKSNGTFLLDLLVSSVVLCSCSFFVSFVVVVDFVVVFTF